MYDTKIGDDEAFYVFTSYIRLWAAFSTCISPTSFVICCPIFFYMQILLTLVEIRLIRHDFNENRFPLSRPRIFIEWSGGSTRCRRGGGNQDHDRHTNNNPSQ
jgi:hypothetical protein